MRVNCKIYELPSYDAMSMWKKITNKGGTWKIKFCRKKNSEHTLIFSILEKKPIDRQKFHFLSSFEKKSAEDFFAALKK